MYSQRTFTFDSRSNILSLADNLSSSESGGLSNASYDTLNRMTSYTLADSTATNGHTYADNGNILTNSKNFGAATYQYTSSRPHAVTQIGDQHFTYDDNGNMLTDAYRQMIYNAQNQLIQVTMTNGVIINYDYDYTGNRVSKQVIATDPYGADRGYTTYYLGDAIEIDAGRLVLQLYANNKKIVTKAIGAITDLFGTGAALKDHGIDMPIGFATTAPFIMFASALFLMMSMRPVRRRYRHGLIDRVMRHWGDYVSTFRETIHAFPQNYAVKLVSLVLIFALGFSFPKPVMAGLLLPESDAVYFYYHHGDHLGSSHVVTEGKIDGGRHAGIVYPRGSLIQRIEYYPFGEQKFVLNPNLDLKPAYTGQQFDADSGLYYYKSRYYNPQIGRFIQPDTVIPDAGNLQGYNRYAYVNNNPLKYRGPDGAFFGDVVD
ncbi:MAG: hypothetical protein HQM16_14585 [Deltaproteobacteria bacterium]|nr:hypothetical protein [Deltaproteobacteria bacterium]